SANASPVRSPNWVSLNCISLRIGSTSTERSWRSTKLIVPTRKSIASARLRRTASERPDGAEPASTTSACVMLLPIFCDSAMPKMLRYLSLSVNVLYGHPTKGREKAHGNRRKKSNRNRGGRRYRTRDGGDAGSAGCCRDRACRRQGRCAR